MRTRRLLTPALLVLACCANPSPRQTTVPLASTALRQNGNQVEAEARARQYCAEYGMRASLENVNRDATETHLSYFCN
jgi:hypothetical protein